MTGLRLDVLIVDRGLAESREKARRLVMAGSVRVNGQVCYKPAARVGHDSEIAITGQARFVGRGGEKLEAALTGFNVDVQGKVCIDVGSSTGGFTDCLLQHGASRVFAVDVGRGQLHWKLRTHLQVTVLEGVNARFLEPELLAERPSIGTVDVSFISLTKVLPAVIKVMEDECRIISLIKPQFEAGRKQVERGGVVRDEAVRRDVVEAVKEFGTGKLGLVWEGSMESPLRGPAGNVEYFACWRKGTGQ